MQIRVSIDGRGATRVLECCDYEYGWIALWILVVDIEYVISDMVYKDVAPPQNLNLHTNLSVNQSINLNMYPLTATTTARYMRHKQNTSGPDLGPEPPTVSRFPSEMSTPRPLGPDGTTGAISGWIGAAFGACRR